VSLRRSRTTITKVGVHKWAAQVAVDAPATDSSRVRRAGDGLCVLLVEADPMTRAPLARALVRQGVNVLVADSLTEALESGDAISMAHAVVFPIEGPRCAALALEVREGFDDVALFLRPAVTEHTGALLALLGPDRSRVLEPRAGIATIVAEVLRGARSVHTARGPGSNDGEPNSTR
jgi:hypothetical protein